MDLEKFFPERDCKVSIECCLTYEDKFDDCKRFKCNDKEFHDFLQEIREKKVCPICGRELSNVEKYIQDNILFY